ncbi:MAG: hypothetical protein COA99_03765 [Moraxellaceae bacterium]|nr:MAG: hypothetical protein COA99_03765 [Moraxellaceae bacterium]
MVRGLFSVGRVLLVGVWFGSITAGCQLLGPAELIHWLEKGDESSLLTKDCQLLDEIMGASGDDGALWTIIMTDGFLRSQARDDLEDKAVALGANTIEITDNREYQKQLKTRLGLFKVEIQANAYRCVN